MFFFFKKSNFDRKKELRRKLACRNASAGPAINLRQKNIFNKMFTLCYSKIELKTKVLICHLSKIKTDLLFKMCTSLCINLANTFSKLSVQKRKILRYFYGRPSNIFFLHFQGFKELNCIIPIF